MDPRSSRGRRNERLATVRLYVCAIKFSRQGITTDVNNEVKKMVLTFFKRQPIKIYLFGSRARGDAKRASDVDIAIEAIKPTLLSKLKTQLEESSIRTTSGTLGSPASLDGRG